MIASTGKKIKFSLKSFLIGGGLGFCFLVALLLVLIGIYHLIFWGRIYSGVKVGGVSLAGKLKREAEVIFSSWSQEKKFNQLKLILKERVWLIDLDKMGIEYSVQGSVEKGFSFGRKSGVIKGLQEKYLALKEGVELEAVYKLNEEELKAQIASIGGQVMIPAVEPEVQVLEATPAGSSSRVIVKQGENGQELDEERALRTIEEKLAYFDQEESRLPVVEVRPKLSESEIEEVRKRAEKLLGKSLLMLTEEQEWILKEKDLINFLGMKRGYDEEKIASYAAQLAEAVDKKPQNAAFSFDGVRVTEFRPGKEGTTLDQEGAREIFKKKLADLEKEGKEKEQIILEIKKTPPEIRTEEVNNLGIRELLGRGESYFRGSIAGRIHNIDLATSRINGILVKPGEVFSLNHALGEVSKNTGYQEAYVIREGKTILGDGGGVCQVSTTLFRAALRAGLPILERRAHAYRVAYYEQGFAPGQDATVWDPSPDLKFKNDTPSHILIQRVFSRGNRYLAFEIYGTSDGRTVTITKSKIWDQTPPPPDVYIDDPTLPAGAVKQIDWSAWGAKVSFGWKVTRGEEVLQDRIFYSSYRPWQAVYLRGTGG